MSVKFDRFLYGGDYNPDQWLEYPQILEDDIRLMKQALINTVSLGIFAWAKLEPEEGFYDFDWMEEIIGRLYEKGISINLATPSDTGGILPGSRWRRGDFRGSCVRNEFVFYGGVGAEAVRKCMAQQAGNYIDNLESRVRGS